MLKPLLKVLPGLSGNVKIACNITDIENVDKNVFISHVRYAKLLPLSSELAQQKVEVNLLKSSYEVDLHRFFTCYSHYFYKSLFDFNKVDHKLLNKTIPQKTRDIDFEFGCKRLSFKKSHYQFAFFAPIYVESENDIPDYFSIKIHIKNNIYETTKTLNINIKDDYKYNYLYLYLSRYCKKIDSSVIYCLPRMKQATYYGIDLRKGCFTKCVDNIIAKNFYNQKTINSFDANITKGFERNYLAMKQILPLCFYFNVNELFTEDELKNLSHSAIYVNGTWFKNGNPVKFYDIDTNYTNLYQTIYNVNKDNGIFDYVTSNKNILDIAYPSLNESKYINYRYSNKICGDKYNRWKLKYSDDEHPYITNFSPAFSFNQDSVYKYGMFPEIFETLPLITNFKNNAIVPFGNALRSKSSPYYSNTTLTTKYFEILNSGATTWYEVYNNDSFDEQTIFEKDIWKDVEDDKVYFKGILYDLDKIYKTYENLKHIDKFSVIMKVSLNKVDKDSLDDIKKADTTIYTSDKYGSDKNTFLFDGVFDSFSYGTFNNMKSLYNTVGSMSGGNSQLVYDKLYVKNEDNDGDFIDLLSLGYDVYDLNRYYKVSNILKYLNDNFYSLYMENIEKLYLFNDRSISGLEYFDVHRLNEILDESNKKLLFEDKPYNKWILENLYFSNKGNRYKTKYDKDSLNELIKDYKYDFNIVPIYILQHFISYSSIKEVLQTILNTQNVNTLLNSILSNIDEYEYQPTLKDEDSGSFANNVFVKRDSIIGRNYGETIPGNKIAVDRDLIYLDLYNMNNVISRYNLRFRTSYPSITESSLNDSNSFIFYAKFLNVNHLYWYVSDLFKDSRNNGTIFDVYNSLYIKKRSLINDYEYESISLKDIYIPLKNLYDNKRVLTKEEMLDIVTNGRRGIQIFKKEEKLYSNTAYREILIFSDDKDYHEEDFYYVPDFYYRTPENKYIDLETYVKNVTDETDVNVLRFINSTTISIIRNYDDSIVDRENVNVYVVRKAINSLELDTNDINDKQNVKYLEKALNIIKGITSKITNSIYYQNPLTKEYVKYSSFVGENDFILLDNNMKKALINGELVLDTYIINDSNKYVLKSFNKDTYYTVIKEIDSTYKDYVTGVVNRFISDVEWHQDDNYYTFNQRYNDKNNLDNIVGIFDFDGDNYSDFSFEIVFKKRFMKLNKTMFDFMNLTDNEEYPYKDLYLYRAYKPEEYPVNLKYYYVYDTIDGSYIEDCGMCLYPLFNEIYLEDKEYSAIYNDFKQSNVYPVKAGSNTFYRCHTGEVRFMYEISDYKDKPFVTENAIYATNSYISSLPLNERSRYAVLPTYDQINNCNSYFTCVSDDLGIYDKFSLNTKDIEYVDYENPSTYTYYSYIIKSNNGKEYVERVENIGYTYNTYVSTYGFLLMDISIDNTSNTFNLVNSKYADTKYFSYINDTDIYSEKYDISKDINKLIPFSKLNIVNKLYENISFLLKPYVMTFNTYYKQSPINDDSGHTYAYDIIQHPQVLDTISLQRYFDSIVPYIKETDIVENTYNLKYKTIEETQKTDYIDDVFYSENMNIYKYSPIRIYNDKSDYTEYYPLEYKHFNDNKFINLEEEIEIFGGESLTYNELLALENDDIVLQKFKGYMLTNNKMNFDDDEILFLINKYDIEYDSICIGLNINKNEKIYNLTYKFKLK